MTMGGSTGMTREEAIERLAESYYDIGALGARWENESDDARLPFREDARRIFDALGLTVAPPPSEEKDAEIARLRAQKDGAYSERDQCVALIARMAVALGYRAGLGRHVGGEWDDDWRNIVFIDLPAGQVSWHIHDSELPLFDFLGQYEAPWDGHSTAEKYERCMGALRQPPPSEEKDAEIARLRGENEKLRGVRVALADLQVSVEVRDQLAAIEREVREAHAEEIASLRAEVARLRQPPPSPSREEAVERLTNMLLHAFAHGARAFGHPVAVAENEGRAMRGGVSPETLEGITDRADTILRTLGLTVAPPPSEEKDAEIARLRAEIDAARAEFFACAEAIGIVYETDGHASAPGPVETVVDFIREARRRSLEHVDCEMRRSAVDTYTVEVPAALVERVREADAGAVLSATFAACEQCGMRRDWAGLTGCPSCATRRAIADDALAQLGGGR